MLVLFEAFSIRHRVQSYLKVSGRILQKIRKIQPLFIKEVYYGLRLNLLKSGARFSLNALRPS